MDGTSAYVWRSSMDILIGELAAAQNVMWPRQSQRQEQMRRT